MRSPSIISSLFSSSSAITDSFVVGSNTTPITTSNNTTSTTGNKKKKARYSRAQKRERKNQLHQQQQQADEERNSNSLPLKRRPGKESKPKHSPSKAELILKCAHQSRFTGSVMMDSSDNDNDRHNNCRGAIQIVSGCDWNTSRQQDPSTSTPFSTTTNTLMRVQPLLILDLNGVLCHRSRQHKEPPNVKLRRPMGCIAQTPVIPRTDLHSLIEYLDHHFCLAVWTSAKSKTAKQLLKLLIPEHIRSKLLFVWSQEQCHAVCLDENHNNDDDDEGGDIIVLSNNDKKNHHYRDVIFEKHLDKVWKAFPLWSADNTLLIDDSPDKCPFAMANAVHPPPINGRRKRPPPQQHYYHVNNNHNNHNHNSTWYFLRHGTAVPIGTTTQQQSSATTSKAKATATASDPDDELLSDEENQHVQVAFFRRLVQFWTNVPFSTSATIADDDDDNNNNDSLEMIIREDMTNTAYYQFLQSYQGSLMGWRPNNNNADTVGTMDRNATTKTKKTKTTAANSN